MPESRRDHFLKRQCWLEEYAQAVTAYQTAVLALQQANNGITKADIERSVLGQALDAKRALQQYRFSF